MTTHSQSTARGPRPAARGPRMRVFQMLAIAASVAGCASDTGGAHVAFDAQAIAVAPKSAAGTIAYDDADTGWHVELTEAKMFVGPIYLWSGAPLNGLSPTDVTTAPTDGAHAGVTIAPYSADQFDFGFLRGQVVDQAGVDLIATAGGGKTPIGTGDGLGGESLSAELWLAPPTTGAPYTFTVAGKATKAGNEIDFTGGLVIDDTNVDETNGDTAFTERKVRAIPFDAQVSEGGTVDVACDARRWLADAPWDDYLVAGQPTVTATITYPDGPWNQWFYQMRQSRGSGPWTLTWEAP